MASPRTWKLVIGGAAVLVALAVAGALAASTSGGAFLTATRAGPIATCGAEDGWLTLSSKMVDGAGTFAPTEEEAIARELMMLGVPPEAAFSPVLESAGSGVYVVLVPNTQTAAAIFTVSEVNGTYVVTSSQTCDSLVLLESPDGE